MTDKWLYGMFKYEHSIHPKKHPSYSLAHLLSVANGSDELRARVYQRVLRHTASEKRTGGFAFEHEAVPRENAEVVPTMINISDQIWFSMIAWVGTRNSRFLEMTDESMELEGGQ